MTAWPKDNQAARNAFYGDPGKGEIAAQMVPVTPDMPCPGAANSKNNPQMPIIIRISATLGFAITDSSCWRQSGRRNSWAAPRLAMR